MVAKKREVESLLDKAEATPEAEVAQVTHVKEQKPYDVSIVVNKPGQIIKTHKIVYSSSAFEAEESVKKEVGSDVLVGARRIRDDD